MKNYTGKYTDEEGTFYFKGDWNGTYIPIACWHRLDGPAVEWRDGNKSYYINNKKYSEKQYWQHPDVLKYKQIAEAKQLLGVKNENE